MTNNSIAGPTVRLLKFFGLLPGQTTKDFLEEVRRLSDEEKAALLAQIDGLRRGEEE